MNGKQYNNVIDWTLTHDEAAQSADSLTTARAVFKNMGVALPQGNLQQIHETLKTDDFMGWRSCTMQEAQEAADNGVAAIGIGDDRLVILSAADAEEPVADTASVMTLSENTSAYAVAGFQYYAYDRGLTTCDPNADANPALTRYFDSLVGTRLTNLSNSSFNGQCINYAFLRMREVAGLSTPANGPRYESPIDWFTRGNDSEYYEIEKVDYTGLKSNYCAIFSGGEYGHIIYLEYIQKNNRGNIQNVYFTEANWDAKDGILKKMSFSDFESKRTKLEGIGKQVKD